MADSEEQKAYRYLIPLEEEDGVEKPAYEVSYEGDVLLNRYNAEALEVVVTESVPHFHKDSVGVGVSEVAIGDYVDDVDEYVGDDSDEDDSSSEEEPDSSEEESDDSEDEEEDSSDESDDTEQESENDEEESEGSEGGE